jgi:ATP-dependent protease HslVU (ClpYQ) ATPase subunit
MYRTLIDCWIVFVFVCVDVFLFSDGINLVWTDGAIRQVAKVAADCNKSIENIGARRLK